MTDEQREALDQLLERAETLVSVADEYQAQEIVARRRERFARIWRNSPVVLIALNLSSLALLAKFWTKLTTPEAAP